MQRTYRGWGPALAAISMVAVVSGVALTGTTLAHKPRIQSTVSIHETFNDVTFEQVFHGRVRSEKAACERHRTVKLKVDGHPGSLGSDTTNRRGRWRIVLPSDNLSGDYYAKATRKITTRWVCRSAESERIHL